MKIVKLAVLLLLILLAVTSTGAAQTEPAITVFGLDYVFEEPHTCLVFGAQAEGMEGVLLGIELIPYDSETDTPILDVSNDSDARTDAGEISFLATLEVPADSFVWDPAEGNSVVMCSNDWHFPIIEPYYEFYFVLNFFNVETGDTWTYDTSEVLGDFSITRNPVEARVTNVQHDFTDDLAITTCFSAELYGLEGETVRFAVFFNHYETDEPVYAVGKDSTFYGANGELTAQVVATVEYEHSFWNPLYGGSYICVTIPYTSIPGDVTLIYPQVDVLLEEDFSVLSSYRFLYDVEDLIEFNNS